MKTALQVLAVLFAVLSAALFMQGDINAAISAMLWSVIDIAAARKVGG